MIFEYKNYGISIIASEEPKIFGYYIRNGKKFLRRYKNPIKNGLSIIDLMKIRNKETKEMINRQLGINLYTS